MPASFRKAPSRAPSRIARIGWRFRVGVDFRQPAEGAVERGLVAGLIGGRPSAPAAVASHGHPARHAIRLARLTRLNQVEALFQHSRPAARWPPTAPTACGMRPRVCRSPDLTVVPLHDRARPRRRADPVGHRLPPLPTLPSAPSRTDVQPPEGHDSRTAEARRARRPTGSRRSHLRKRKRAAPAAARWPSLPELTRGSSSCARQALPTVGYSSSDGCAARKRSTTSDSHPVQIE